MLSVIFSHTVCMCWSRNLKTVTSCAVDITALSAVFFLVYLLKLGDIAQKTASNTPPYIISEYRRSRQRQIFWLSVVAMRDTLMTSEPLSEILYFEDKLQRRQSCVEVGQPMRGKEINDKQLLAAPRLQYRIHAVLCARACVARNRIGW
jgi:hypothetical protein